jgi:hypothetical protein
MPTAISMQRFVEEELAGSAEFIDRVLAGTVQLLRDAHEGLSGAERALHVELGIALQQQAPRYRDTFISTLKQRVREALDGRARAANEDELESLDGLQLMDESRVEIDIEISRAMQLIDTTAEWQLRELQTFTSTLVGLDYVSPDSNPLRPLVYAASLWEAACAVVEAQLQRATLLRLSAGVAAGLLKKAWAAACTRLEAHGVEPGVYRTRVLPPGATSHPAHAAHTAHAGRTPRPGALATLLASMPGLAGSERAREAVSAGPTGFAGAPEAAGTGQGQVAHAGSVSSEAFEQVLRRLDELLRSLPRVRAEDAPGAASMTALPSIPSVRRLAHHRAAMLASVGTGPERQIIELLSRLYEAILSDPQLPSPWRAVLARLQVASLRVALRDAAMMASHDHEVWRLLDGIGSASLAYPDAGDPRGASLLEFCQALTEAVVGAASPDATLCRQARQRLERFLATQAQAQLQAAQTAVAALQLAERRELLEQHLSQRLSEQLAAVHLTPLLRRFVTGTWAKVLADVIARTGEASAETRAYLKSSDDLLWSLQVPGHPQSRQRLIELLPALLQRLRSGMQGVGRPAAEQQAVLNELMAIHTAALRSGQGATLTAEQIVQRMRDEIICDVPERRAFSDSLIDLSSIETVPADLLPTAPPDEDDPGQRIEQLRPAERLRIFLLGRWRPVQLLWRSERGLYFLLAGDADRRTHSITRRALERLGGAGLIRPLETKPLLQRAIDSLLQQQADPA